MYRKYYTSRRAGLVSIKSLVGPALSHAVLSNFEVKKGHVLTYGLPKGFLTAPLYFHIFPVN